MFYTDGKLHYPVRVENPNPLFAKMLQQAIGGIEGEIRVMLQYFFQAWGHRGSDNHRDMLLSMGTEEVGHIEMLATAVALNLEGSSADVQQEAAEQDPMVAAVMGGMSPRHYLSAGLTATPTNSEGVPFDTSHVYSSGNIIANMYSNLAAETTGRLLATRLYHVTDDPGMRDMLAFLIARDTMHQNQWLAVIEDLGGYEGTLPVPNTFPQDQENQDFNYTFVDTRIGEDVPPFEGSWTSGPSLDSTGEFSVEPAEPQGERPELGPAEVDAFPQAEELEDDAQATPEA